MKRKKQKTLAPSEEKKAFPTADEIRAEVSRPPRMSDFKVDVPDPDPFNGADIDDAFEHDGG